MRSSTLPERPHLDHLRRQARELHRALQSGDAAAQARAAPYKLVPPSKLSGAQLVLAREHGFDSWPQLVQEVERRNALALPDSAFVQRVLELVFGHGWHVPQPARALALLRSERALGQAQPLIFALMLGDLKAVQRALAGTDLSAPLPPLGAPPLAYAAASSLARVDALRPGLAATVQWLLAQGADPNSLWADPARPDEKLPVLYSAVSRASCFDTVQALLQAGANPNDQESLYHATEQSDRRIIAALVRAGARWQGTNALYRQLDHDNLDHLRQVLELGADVHERIHGGGGPLHHAITRGRSLAFVKLLLAHGADPAAKDAQGRTPAELAARLGDADTAAHLAALGHGAVQSPQEAFLAACAAGDAVAARAHLAAQPDAIGLLDAHALRLLPDQAQRGRLHAVRLMLELGWPVDVKGDWYASALNQAAFRGDAAMAKLLLDHGARWHERNGYGGDTVGSCLHAAINEPNPAGDYAGVLSLLMADGAPAPRDEENLPDELRALLSS
jgi:ankyrin repeat protein